MCELCKCLSRCLYIFPYRRSKCSRLLSSSSLLKAKSLYSCLASDTPHSVILRYKVWQILLTSCLNRFWSDLMSAAQFWLKAFYRWLGMAPFCSALNFDIVKLKFFRYLSFWIIRLYVAVVSITFFWRLETEPISVGTLSRRLACGACSWRFCLTKAQTTGGIETGKACCFRSILFAALALDCTLVQCYSTTKTARFAR